MGSGKQSKIDLVGGILFVFVLILTIIWIDNSNNQLLLLFAIISIFSIFIYYKRAINIDLDVRAPLADSLIVMSGINISIFFLTKLIKEFNQSIDNSIGQFLKQFTPTFGLILLFSGIMTRLFLLDAILKESLNNINNAFEGILKWTTLKKINFIRFGLFACSIYVFFFRNSIDQKLSGTSVDAGFVIFSLLSLVFVLSSFAQWPSGKRKKLRIGCFIFGSLIIVFPFELFRDIRIPGTRILGLAIIIWTISFPTLFLLVRYVLLLGKRLLAFIKNVASRIYNKIKQKPILSLRIGLAFSGIILIIIGLLLKYDFLIVISSGTFLLLPLLRPILYQFTLRFTRSLVEKSGIILSKIKLWLIRIKDWINDNLFLSLRISSFSIGLLFFIIAPKNHIDDDNLNFGLNVVGGFSFIVISLLPTVFNFLKGFLPRLYNEIVLLTKNIITLITTILISLHKFLNNFAKWISENSLLFLRFVSTIFGIIVYYIAPEKNAINVFGAAFLIFLALLPTLIKLFRFIFPLFVTLIISIIAYFSNLSKLSGWLGVASIVGIYIIPDNLTVKLVLAILAGIFLSFGWNFFFMRIFEYIIYGLILILNSFLKLLKYLYSKLTINSLITMFAWALLAFSIFFTWLLPDIRGEFIIRTVIFIGSITIWNLAYDYRRKRCYKFINWATLGLVNGSVNIIQFIWKLLVNSLKTIVRNILIIIAWMVGLFLFYLSFGLLFPGSVGLTSSIFGDMSGDRLVSIIVAISLSGIAFLSIQQSLVRRESLQLSEIKK